MYVGKKVTETRAQDDLLPYTCGGCGWEGAAFVTGVGQGAGNSMFFLDNAGAKRRAGESAADAAAENARLTITLATCPRCGWRDEAAVRRFWAKLVGAAVGGVAFLWALGAFLYALEGSAAALWIFGPLGPVTGAIILWTQVWQGTTVGARVVFADEPD